MTIYFVLKLMVVSRGRLRLYTRCVYITVQHEDVWIYVGYASINDCIAKRKYTKLQSKRL